MSSIENFYTFSVAKIVVRAMGIENAKDYLKRFQRDSRLPSYPHSFYADSGWTGWHDFLGKEKPHWYSYSEAQAVVNAMGVKNVKDYNARFRQDPQLPATPHQFYSGAGWTDWFDFLGKEKSCWYSYAEARAVVLAMGVQGSKEYRARYREDPRLVAEPNRLYTNAGWVSWNDFLGKEPRREKQSWYTYVQAKVVVQSIGIKSQVQYRGNYKVDPRLPSTPQLAYANSGWVGWYDFLGNKKPDLYSTYTEAKLAVQVLKIKNQTDYQSKYREDPRLPSIPNKTYSGDWVDWYDYLGVDRPDDLLALFPSVFSDLSRWLENEHNIQLKTTAIKVLLNGFFLPLGLPDDSKHILLRTTQFDSIVYTQLIDAQADTLKKPYHSAIASFFQWILDEDCTDDDGDERVVLPDFRNPFLTILAGFADSIETYRPSQSTKAPLGYEYILRARNFLVPNGEAALQARPTLRDLPHLQELFSSRADWYYVSESMIDRDDPNCIWRKVDKADRVIAGKRRIIESYQIWSPVRFIAMYTLFRFPLRGQQILWLDSGEADHEIATIDANGSVLWKKNTGPLVGRGSKKTRPQAAVQRGADNNPNLYVTTNKTGQRDGGYDIEWIPEDLLYWFLLLRDWQAKYNPLTKPTSWTETKLRVAKNDKYLKSLGTQCFLFRTDVNGQPLQTTTAFTHMLPELLYIIQREGEDLVLKNEATNNRLFSPYTPHSLRVSLITALINDGKAPLHLISKLVGHSSLVMTIYYVKLNREQISVPMGEAEKLAAQRAAERSAELIKYEGFRALSGQLIVTDSNRSLIESDVPATACVVFDCGICPMAASSCHSGGPVVAERKADNLYGPVVSGYLGQKNCPQCRYFITGVPFLGGLVSLANEISLEIHTESFRYTEFSSEFISLENDFYDSCKENKVFLHEVDRKRASNNQQQSAGKLKSLLSDYSSVYEKIQSCLRLINQNDSNPSDEVRLIVSGDTREVGVAFSDSKTSYHLLAEICQNATIYKSTNYSRAVPLITQAIDLMAANNGLAPAMFKLNERQKLVVANELNQLLLQRLGSWEKIDDLFAGDLMLLDVDAHAPELTSISDEVRKLLHSPNRVLNIPKEQLYV